ncbi:MAG TPA: hypothetical protein VK211_02675 [Kamptonema sp.]|nr:hypothetical protein [Kamptonema sp.]
MTAIVAGTTPGTIKAVTLGNYIWQLVNWAIQAQKDTTKNPQVLDYISLSTDPEAVYDNYPTANGGEATISFTAPCSTIVFPFAQPESVVVPDYLTNSGFVAGSGGSPTFTSASWCQNLWDAIQILQSLQIKAATNTLALQLVSSAAINLETNIGTNLNASLNASLTLPLISTVDSGTGNILVSGASPMGGLS